jgi:hypothetical protein
MLLLKKLFRFLILILIPVTLAGCLTCESKEYVFQLTGENSGKLTIKYVNIFSNQIDSIGEISADYDELINMWLKGRKLENYFPGATKISKRLFRENGVLCGEVTMDFDNLSKVHLYRYQGKGPFMFSMAAVNDDGETFKNTNGEYPGEKMPIIFWPSDTRTLRFTTKIAESDSTCVSMLPIWEGKKF